MITPRVPLVRRGLSAWRERSPAARIADVLVLLAVLLLTVAIVVNSIADTRSARRMAIDLKVYHRYLAQHPELGRFGYPLIKVNRRTDLACGWSEPLPIPPIGGGARMRPETGYCLIIAGRPNNSQRILYHYPCMAIPTPTAHDRHPTRPRLPSGWGYCPSHHAMVT